MREIRNDGLITIHKYGVSATGIDNIFSILPAPRMKLVVSVRNRR